MLNCLLEPSVGENRSVSGVSAHASNRMGVQPPALSKKELTRCPHQLCTCLFDRDWFSPFHCSSCPRISKKERNFFFSVFSLFSLISTFFVDFPTSISYVPNFYNLACHLQWWTHSYLAGGKISSNKFFSFLLMRFGESCAQKQPHLTLLHWSYQWAFITAFMMQLWSTIHLIFGYIYEDDMNPTSELLFPPPDHMQIFALMMALIAGSVPNFWLLLLGSAILPPSQVPGWNPMVLYVAILTSPLFPNGFRSTSGLLSSILYITIFHLFHFCSPSN